MSAQRKIIHVDMDAFYASVEQRDNPELRGKPVAVGGGRERGVVAAASYEARKFGVKSAMSSRLAAQKCPDLIFVKPRLDVYRTVSLIIRSIFKDYTDLIEPLALDEAFLDVTQNKKNISSATMIAQEIKDRIKEQTDLTASAGVSMNKFLAKVASDYDKPNGLFVITPEEAEEFIERLPITRFFGVGKVTAEKMKANGIYYGRNLKSWSLEDLTKKFGKQGAYYYNLSRAQDFRKVNPNRERKSLGAERTFSSDLFDEKDLEEKLVSITTEVERRVKKSKVFGRTLTLKVKFHDFEQITRSKTFDHAIINKEELLSESTQLLKGLGEDIKAIRLLGVSLSNFEQDEEKNIQLEIEYNT